MREYTHDYFNENQLIDIIQGTLSMVSIITIQVIVFFFIVMFFFIFILYFICCKSTIL